MSDKDNVDLNLDLDFDIEEEEEIDFDFSFDDETTENTIEKQSKKSLKTKTNKEDASEKARDTTKKQVDKKDKKDKKKKRARDKKVSGNKSNKNKKNTIIKTVIIIILSILFIGVTSIVALQALNSSNQHIKTVDTPIVEITDTPTEQETEGKTEIIETEQETEIIETSTKDKLNIGDKITTKTVVNTKIKENGDTEYRDYDTYINITLDAIEVGYDNIIKYVNSYNEVSDNIIQLDDKDNFYKNYADYELVMYSVKLSIPKSFPTQDLEKGKTVLKPELNLYLQGKDKENKNKIITDKYEYKIPETTNITNTHTEFIINNEYEYKWIAILPKGINGDTYNIKINYKDNNNINKTYTYLGKEIK